MCLLRNAPPVRVEEDEGRERFRVCQAQDSSSTGNFVSEVVLVVRDSYAATTYCSIISSGSLLNADLTSSRAAVDDGRGLFSMLGRDAVTVSPALSMSSSTEGETDYFDM